MSASSSADDPTAAARAALCLDFDDPLPSTSFAG